MMTGEEIATDAEALAYVSNASLCVPLASEWVDIYEYLLTKVMGDKVPEEMRKEELTDYKMSLLRELKGWIWKRRKKVRDERAKGERAEAKTEAAARAPKQLNLGV